MLKSFYPKYILFYFFGHLFDVFLMNYELIEDSVQYINQVFLYGVYPSLHSDCHHPIVFAKINLNFAFPQLDECE